MGLSLLWACVGLTEVGSGGICGNRDVAVGSMPGVVIDAKSCARGVIGAVEALVDNPAILQDSGAESMFCGVVFRTK